MLCHASTRAGDEFAIGPMPATGRRFDSALAGAVTAWSVTKASIRQPWVDTAVRCARASALGSRLAHGTESAIDVALHAGEVCLGLPGWMCGNKHMRFITRSGDEGQARVA